MFRNTESGKPFKRSIKNFVKIMLHIYFFISIFLPCSTDDRGLQTCKRVAFFVNFVKTTY